MTKRPLGWQNFSRNFPIFARDYEKFEFWDYQKLLKTLLGVNTLDVGLTSFWLISDKNLMWREIIFIFNRIKMMIITKTKTMISNSFHTLPHCATEWWYWATQYHTVPQSATQYHSKCQIQNSQYFPHSRYSPPAIRPSPCSKIFKRRILKTHTHTC